MAFNFAHLLSAACGGAARRLCALRARFFSLFLSFSQCNFTEKMPFFRACREQSTPKIGPENYSGCAGPTQAWVSRVGRPPSARAPPSGGALLV